VVRISLGNESEPFVVGDSALKNAVRDLPKLKGVSLEWTNVTDEGLDFLMDLPNLKMVLLERCKVTREGVKAFKRSRPEVIVLYYDLSTPIKDADN
jgi:hypothetical protein